MYDSMADLFSSHNQAQPYSPEVLDLGDGIYLIKKLAPSELCLLHIRKITEISPFRKMMTPMGHPMQVSTSNCGEFGWIASEQGYQYSHIDPLTSQKWCSIPAEYLQLHKYALELAALPAFTPDACLINRYEIGQSMGQHKDKDEADLNWPIVSISLGLSATFQVGGQTRSAPKRDILLEDGDVIILSGSARNHYHGVKPVKSDPLDPNRTNRYNLTFRKSQ